MKMVKRLCYASVAAAALTLGAGHASAATLVVDDLDNGDCIPAAYATIQAAINAASPGDSILVCPGTYVEDLQISTDNLALAAYDRANKSNTVIQGVAISPGPFPNCGTAPGGADPSIANINISANGVSITGFTIQSPAVTLPGEYTCGLIVEGRNNTIYQNAFKVSCGDSPTSDSGSVAIQTWALANGPIGSIDGLRIVGNSFSSSKLDTLASCVGYEAIYINPQTVAPSTNPVTIVSNTFSGKMYRGVQVDGRDWTDVKYNKLETKLRLRNDHPLYLANFPIGIRLRSETSISNAVVLGNEIGGEEGGKRFAVGISLSAAAMHNVVTKNVVQGSRVWDCFDGSAGGGTAGTANLWERNIGRKASPSGICGRGRDDDD